MIVFKKAFDLTAHVIRQKKAGLTVGFVPTMGALHPGHLKLIESSRKESDITVCSIFVNPTQFNNPTDFAKYPLTIEKDIEQLLSIDCDILFLPSKEEIYPAGYMAVHYNLDGLDNILEGKYRPGHFQGVCQVVDRLLQIVEPTQLFLGAKDYQQCMVIDKLLALTNRKACTTLRISPTMREPDGLAMSSRNLRLSPQQRETAPQLYQSLRLIRDNYSSANDKEAKEKAVMQLIEKGFRVDYLEIRDAATLLPNPNAQQHIALVAAYLGEIRLIDNLPLC